MTPSNTKEKTMTDEKPENGPESNDPVVEAPNPSSTTEEPGDDNLGTEDDTPDVAKLRREAAGHRAKLRDAEAERDAVTVQRDALAAAVLSDALRGTGVNSELFATAGRSVDEFITDGALDRSAITRAGREVAKQFGIVGGRSPHTGTGTERPPETGKTWSDAIQKA